MARNAPEKFIKYDDDDIMLLDGGGLLYFEPKRQKVIHSTYHAGGGTEKEIVFWGDDNSLPEYREALLCENNIVPQIIRAKRDIILGGGLMTYKEHFEKGKRIVEEVKMDADFSDWLEEQEELHGGPTELADDLLKHGNFFPQCIRDSDGKIKTIKPHMARCVRARKQNNQGIVPSYFLHGQWGSISKLSDKQRLSEVKSLIEIDAYNPAAKKPQPNFIMHGADRLLGGPYYFEPHYTGSEMWMKVANAIPVFHFSNLENGFNIRYLIKVPEDYFMRSLAQSKREDKDNLHQHIRAAKQSFKERVNKFLAGMRNAGRGLIVTKHFYKHLQKEWPELEIVPLEVDLKDEAMLKLYESSNQASTSAHGIPPVLAGLATGAKMTSGNEIRNLYNFWQITATPQPRKIISRPYRLAWLSWNKPRDIKLGFRNIELTTTDKNPSGHSEPQINPDAV
ncbi:MAG: hypothetical protein AAFP77_19760 [Bacteroidota bacterium]